MSENVSWLKQNAVPIGAVLFSWFASVVSIYISIENYKTATDINISLHSQAIEVLETKVTSLEKQLHSYPYMEKRIDTLDSTITEMKHVLTRLTISQKVQERDLVTIKTLLQKMYDKQQQNPSK